MRTFKSKTGYIKSLIDNIIYENDTIYLGIYDKEENYTYGRVIDLYHYKDGRPLLEARPPLF